MRPRRAVDILPQHRLGRLDGWSFSLSPVAHSIQKDTKHAVQVERVNGGMKLGEYMRRFIFDPLGIRDSAFHLEHREEMRARKGKLWERTPGGLEEMKTPFWSDPITDDMGGGGLYSTVSDLLKLYRGILRGDVLRIETVKAMFLPQLFSTTGLDKPEDIPVNH